jgi:glycosyltransferase involved in cell wall biosynthesis
MLMKEFPNLQMLVCGKGYMQKPVQGLTQIHRLNGSLKMLGFVSDDGLPALYALSDIVVVPSLHSESFGIPLIEAMASGKPVIATKVSGIPEVVKNGVTGLLVEKRSCKEIAESLRFILSNPEEYLKMSKAARELAVKEYSWDNIVTRIENVYLEVTKTILTPNYI